ncbi:MAG: hypothetical protein K2X77_33440 [Candidatus Obscuribacterales bacterium]|nr:hypothetical protein [Candidatus Obscuribacterales bacterium]
MFAMALALTLSLLSGLIGFFLGGMIDQRRFRYSFSVMAFTAAAMLLSVGLLLTAGSLQFVGACLIGILTGSLLRIAAA